MASEYSGLRKGKADKGKGSAAPQTAQQADSSRDTWDPRPYRPIEVILDLSVNNLVAHLIKNCSKGPYLYDFRSGRREGGVHYEQIDEVIL